MADFINLNVEMSEDAKKYLDVVADETAKLANTYVAKAAKNARGQAKEIEGSVLDIQRGKQYFRKTTAPNKGDKWAGMHTTESYWDTEARVYRTKNRKGKRKKNQKGDPYLRLENFTFSNAAGGKKKYYSTKSEARLTSNLANLHEYDVFFPKGSIRFSKGLMSKWMRYRPGARRKGKHFFNKYATAVISTLPKSEEEAVSQWDEAIRRNTKNL